MKAGLAQESYDCRGAKQLMAASHAGLGLAAHVVCCRIESLSTEIVLKKAEDFQNSLLFEKESRVGLPLRE
jgi:hypothetical protein